MTLHKEIQIIFAAVRELLEVADAIATMRGGRDEDHADTYGAFPFSTKPGTDCSELLDAVAAMPVSSKRYHEDSKLKKWETAVDSDARRVVKLLFADYKAKKELLSRLLGRDVVSATQMPQA